MIFVNSRDSLSNIILQSRALPRSCISSMICASVCTSTLVPLCDTGFCIAFCLRSCFSFDRHYLSSLSSIFSSFHTYAMRFGLFERDYPFLVALVHYWPIWYLSLVAWFKICSILSFIALSLASGMIYHKVAFSSTIGFRFSISSSLIFILSFILLWSPF